MKRCHSSFFMESKFIVSFLIILLTTNGGMAQVYLDSTAPIAARVSDLLGQMTLAEKIGQMTQAERGQFNGAAESNITTYGVGSILSGGGSSPGNTVASWVTMYNNFQNRALQTRLGIPLIYGVDAVHGHNNLYGAVIFPHNIGLGCTRNPSLVEACARITALEVVATGVDWTFSPCVAVPRNERWGRTYEGFGEDPQLVSELGAASIRGYQSDSLGTAGHMAACAKHFIADGGTSGGTDQGNTQITESLLRSLHLPPYSSAIDEGVATVMASYSKWNGSPCHNDEYLLNQILKQELGFEGFVISDWEGINKLPVPFDTAIAQSINAGIDMAMQPNDYLDFQNRLTNLVNANVVPMSRIDDAVARILRVKFQLGLFEHPNASLALADTVGCDSHRAVARQAVRESMVLLKNESVLPLSPSSTVLLAGARADDIGSQCGGWSISWQGGLGTITEGTTIKQGFEAAIGAGNVNVTTNPANLPPSDVAVVVVGENPYAEGAGDIGPSNVGFFISAGEQAMIDAVAASGMPMVVVLLSGRPLMLDGILDQADAVIAAWLPGTEGGGIVDVLMGEYSPTGKLSHSWPRNPGQVPINVGDPGYDPLFPYGFGLTYEASSISEPDLAVSLGLRIGPNPFEEELLIHNPQQHQLSMGLYDGAGRRVMEFPTRTQPQYRLQTKHLPAGVYSLRVQAAAGTLFHRVVKR
jgi:beta-glucosidase